MRVTLCLGALIMAAAAVTASAEVTYPTLPIWPMPTTFTVDPTLTATVSAQVAPIFGCQISTDLSLAWSRFALTTFGEHVASPTGHAITTISICAKDVTAPLVLGVNETYSLSITTNEITLTCTTIYGCYHGLESLSQAIQFDFDAKAYVSKVLDVKDSPRFPHRGLLVDTSRHFLPVRTLRKIIDALVMVKMNVMHWHIVDAIAFPYDSAAFPQLAKHGAYSSRERFTANDITSIVEYARQRGIRVLVELDTPGHSGSYCFGMPEICPSPLCTSANINNWALDITKNVTYSVVGTLLKELTGLFPDQYIHLGGDEVDTYCWTQHPDIMKWLAERNLTPKGGFGYYFKKVTEMAEALNRHVIGWQEIWDTFGTALTKGTIIQQWLPNSISLPLNVTNHGYQLIWSDSSVWYLDHLSVTWEQMYAAEPCNGLPSNNCKLILGGEGAMWGETVDTSDSLQTIFPRAAAIAERLWSPRTTAVLDKDTPVRLANLRCMMESRGIPAAPILNPLARSAPPQPGSCYLQ